MKQSSEYETLSNLLSTEDMEKILLIMERVCAAAFQTDFDRHETPSNSKELLQKSVESVLMTFVDTIFPAKNFKIESDAADVLSSVRCLCLSCLTRWLALTPHDDAFSPAYGKVVPVLLDRLPRLLWQITNTKFESSSSNCDIFAQACRATGLAECILSSLLVC